jgi:hypothetical protein
VASLILTTECVIKKKETPRLWGASYFYANSVVKQ